MPSLLESSAPNSLDASTAGMFEFGLLSWSAAIQPNAMAKMVANAAHSRSTTSTLRDLLERTSKQVLSFNRTSLLLFSFNNKKKKRIAYASGKTSDG
jgi:hypothetical protein